jgi:hypothetical protein
MEELSNNASYEADYNRPNDAHVCAPPTPITLEFSNNLVKRLSATV